MTALFVLCHSFSIYSSTPCTFEAVEIIDDKNKFNSPELNLNRQMNVTIEQIKRIVGIDLNNE